MAWQMQKKSILNQLRKLGLKFKGIFNIKNMPHGLAAYLALLKHYKAVFQFWWARREQIKMPELRTHEAEFLPAALALQAAPVSPAGRWIARILMIMMLIVLLWSVLGKFDIIVNGQGKIIASGYTKTIASPEVAKVVLLNVEEGQTVKAGDLLIALDTRGVDSERDKADGERQLALLQMERAKALLGAINQKAGIFIEPRLDRIEGVDEIHYRNEVYHLEDQWRDFMAKFNNIKSKIDRYRAALPLAQAIAEDYAVLSNTHDVPGHLYIEKEQAVIDLQGQLNEAKTALTSLITETSMSSQEALYQATRIWSSAKQDINRTQAHSEQLRITSPVDGVVQQLTVHTIGGIVPAAQALMFIVPSHHTVEFEAYVENKDIGFMLVGQTVKIKIDAFDYTKYGTISAKVTHISRDAVDLPAGTSSNSADLSGGKGAVPKGGLMYAVKVTLDQPYIAIDGKEVGLSPGMTGSVEIKTGSRRVIEYALSPLITHGKESLHER